MQRSPRSSTFGRPPGAFAIDERPDTSASSPPAPSIPDYADVGDRVSSILKAAEEAARQIRADAERAAETTRREAESEAERRAGERRRELDGEAERVVADARADAEKIRATARAAAQRVAEEGHRRLEELQGEGRAVARRFESAIDELHKLLTQLEAVVPTSARRVDEADLADALRPASERAESSRPER